MMCGKRWLVTMLLGVTGCLAACGGDDSGGETGGETCSIDVSGAVMAAPDCESPALTYNAGAGELTLSFASPDGVQPVVIGSFRAPGEPSLETYSTESAGVICAIGVNDGALAWNANNSNPEDVRGSCTLSFTAIEEESRVGDFATYRGTGSVTATMDAIETSGAMGTATATIDFNL